MLQCVNEKWDTPILPKNKPCSVFRGFRQLCKKDSSSWLKVKGGVIKVMTRLAVDRDKP